MRKIDLVAIHCSAMREDRCFTELNLDVCHRRRGFNGSGCHFYIRKDGWIVSIRPVERIRACTKGHNATSIGICYEEGLGVRGRPKGTQAEWQVYLMWVLVEALPKQYSDNRARDHRDLSPDLNANGEIGPEEWIKQCPCLDVSDDKKSH